MYLLVSVIMFVLFANYNTSEFALKIEKAIFQMTIM